MKYGDETLRTFIVTTAEYSEKFLRLEEQVTGESRVWTRDRRDAGQRHLSESVVSDLMPAASGKQAESDIL